MMTIVLLSTISNRQAWQNSKHYFRVYRITYRDVAKAKSLASKANSLAFVCNVKFPLRSYQLLHGF